MFPGLGERVIEAGNDKIRIKYCCPSIKVHIHRDIMAAENMADILVYENQWIIQTRISF
jgi:transposase